jgi:hypothetical protein
MFNLVADRVAKGPHQLTRQHAPRPHRASFFKQQIEIQTAV